MKRLLKYYRKILFCFLIILMIQFFCTSHTFAETDAETESSDEIMTAQKSSLNIGEFIEQCKKYTSNVFGDTDFNELLNSSIKGDIDNGKIGKTILGVLGKETIGAVRTIRTYYDYYYHTFCFKKYE